MSNHKDLKFDFIEMLFALAVGDLAIQFGQLIIHDVFANYFYIYSHLLLALFILAFSFVGWRNSTSIGHVKSVKSIVSISFLILLLDLILVIIYFIIIHNVETYEVIQEQDPRVMPAEAMTETRWSMVIFGIYFIWDILTKLFDEKYVKNNKVYVRKRFLNFKSFFRRTWPTVVCFILCLIIYKSLESNFYDHILVSDKNAYVVVVDFLLLLIFAIFRGLKQIIKKDYQIEEDELPQAKIEECKSNGFEFPLSVQMEIKYYRFKLFLLKYMFLISFIILYLAYFRFIFI